MMSKFLGLLLGQRQIPDTQIFFGRSHKSTLFGAIDLKGMEDDPSKAIITLIDQDRQKKNTELQVFNLDTLMKMPVFQSSVEDIKAEKLVNTWHTRRHENTILKVASKMELAFSYTSPSDVENDLSKLYTLDLRTIDYFNEVFFCKFLQNKLNLSIDQLRTIPGMNESRIHFLLKNYHGFENLIKHGFTIEQIGIMNQELMTLLINHLSKLEELLRYGITPSQLASVSPLQLKKVFDHSYHLNGALKFITIQQILGIDNKPLPLDEIKKTINFHGVMGMFEGKVVGSFGSSKGQFGDYLTSSESSSNKKTVSITHLKNKRSFEVISETLQDDASKIFDGMKKDIPATSLIHDWYIIQQKNGRILYCPELKNVTQEKKELNVPNHLLEGLMLKFNFYREKQFIEFLAKKGCPIDRFRALPGMSENKLKLLFENQYAMQELIAKGIKLEEFALINDLRLENILINYSRLSDALEFVSLAQIVDFSPSIAIQQNAILDESFEGRKKPRMR